MNGFTKKATFYVLVGLTAILCLISISYRVRVEQANRVVGLCMDLNTIQDLAAASGKPTSVLLTSLKERGLTAVTMSADPLNELIQRQVVAYDGSVPMIVARDPEVEERVRLALTARFGLGPWSKPSGPQRSFIPVGGLPFDTLVATSLGISPADARLVKSAGIQIIARHGNPNGATSRYIEALLDRSKKLGATVYLPEGDQVLGQRDLVKETAADLKDLGIQYASPEFSKLGGDAVLVEQTQELLIRLHSIQQSEIDKMAVPEVVERFEKAYRERNIRLLLVRPVSSAGDDPVEGVGSLLSQIKAAVIKDGATLGAPVPYVKPGVPTVLLLMIALGAGACIAWVGLGLFENRIIRILGLLFVGLLVIASFAKTGREFMALAAATAMPIGAYLTLDLAKIRPFPDFARLSAISLVGGLCVAGLLNDLPYFIRVDQFPGVKLAHFLPILVVGLVLVGKQVDWRQAARSPATWGGAVLGVVVLMALAFMFARTGNDNPAAVSSLELKFRDLLDAFLYTRPRTKEFLMGHPALIMGLCLMMSSLKAKAARGYAVAGGLLLTIGAIGQTSIVNTLCHLHTPVLLSLSRILIGWVIGGILGGLLWALFRAKWPAIQASEEG